MSEGNPRTERAAFFAAGQAVSLWRDGVTTERIFLDPEDANVWLDVVEPALPLADEPWGKQDYAAAESLIRALLSGPAAQERYSFGACSDDLVSLGDAFTTEDCVWRAIGIAGQIESAAPVLSPLWREVRDFMESEEGWAAVCAAAKMLLECGELSGFEIADFARHALCRTG